MTPNLTRVMLSLALLILSVFTWLGVVVLTYRSNSSNAAFLAADLATAGFVALGWLAIWRRAVSWMRARVIWTSVVLILAVLAAMGAYGAVCAAVRETDVALVMAVLTWGAAWIAGTAIIWRETAAERAARGANGEPGGPMCLNCGYSMKGLHEARCPECGRQYTLDELLAAQRPRDPLEPR